MSWQIDYNHSHIQFSARHMMISKIRGDFNKFSGTIELDEANPAATKVDIQIEAASINTRDAQRDGHLKSPDFLNADVNPYLTFQSTQVEVVDSTTAKLHGNLTIRDIAKPVTLDVEYQGQSKTPWGNTIAGFTATTKINREDWGLTWNAVLETGGIAVSKEIGIEIEMELVKQP